MIYSLYQFKRTTAPKLLGKFRKNAKKKIIIEEILEKKNKAILNKNKSLNIAQRIGMVLKY
jgi:hypothetical protein